VPENSTSYDVTWSVVSGGEFVTLTSGGLVTAGRIWAPSTTAVGQCLEIFLSATNFLLLGRSQIADIGSAFGFQHKIQRLFTVFVHVNRPLGMGCADGRFSLEFGRFFEEHPHIRGVVERNSKWRFAVLLP
jgi:hypothetical protein